MGIILGKETAVFAANLNEANVIKFEDPPLSKVQSE